MAVVMKLVAPALPLPPGHPALALVGAWVIRYNPHADAQLWEPEMLTYTHNVDEATRFEAPEALALWRTANGLRPDGKPNRPLTAFTVSLDRTEDRK